MKLLAAISAIVVAVALFWFLGPYFLQGEGDQYGTSLINMGK